MDATEPARNPFALFLDPAQALQVHRRAGDAGRFKRQVYRPLDKPRLTARQPGEVERFDAKVDEEPAPHVPVLGECAEEFPRDPSGWRVG